MKLSICANLAERQIIFALLPIGNWNLAPDDAVRIFMVTVGPTGILRVVRRCLHFDSFTSDYPWFQGGKSGRGMVREVTFRPPLPVD